MKEDPPLPSLQREGVGRISFVWSKVIQSFSERSERSFVFQ